MSANATAFFGASYTLIATAELAATGVNLGSFTLVVFVTALGATLGKIVIYFTAVGLQRSLQKNKNVRLLGLGWERADSTLGCSSPLCSPSCLSTTTCTSGRARTEASWRPCSG